MHVHPIARSRSAEGRAPRRARRHGRLPRTCARVQRRRFCVFRPAHHAPGAGVREGLRRRGRAARAGTATHRGRTDERGAVSAELGLTPVGPAVAEESIIARDVLLAEHVGSRLHVCHLSTAGSVDHHPLGQEARRERHRRGDSAPPAADRRVRRDYDARFKVNPPLRREEYVMAVREGLADGTIDIVATDHAPHPAEAKACEWAAAGHGMVTGERLRVVQQAMVDTGLLDWSDVARVLSKTPARIGRLDGHAPRWPRGSRHRSRCTTRAPRAPSRRRPARRSKKLAVPRPGAPRRGALDRARRRPHRRRRTCSTRRGSWRDA